MKHVICLFYCLLFSVFADSQTLLEDMDFSTFSANALSTEEVVQIQDEIERRSLSMSDFRSLSISKGMKPSEFDALEVRLNSLPKKAKQDPTDKVHAKPNPEEHGSTKATGNDGWIFGSEIFSNSALSFEPNQTLSNPSAYLLGVGDELEIAIHGIQQFSQTARVNSQGDIVLANIGSIHVSGLQLGAASDFILKKASAIYRTLAAGRSELSVTISEFKSIQVTMIGVKQPGNYTLSSLSTVFNALHIAGGPSENGTYRNIELIRNNKLFKVIDLYKFLTEGDLSDNFGLQQNDILRVPTYAKRVTIQGSVKRPGVFELLEGEGFEDLIRYCSGFSDDAYRSSLQIITTTDSEMQLKTVAKENFASIALKSGDVVKVGELLATYQNKVKVSGAVFRPESYELVDGMRVADLIKMADGMKPDAFGERALLMRKGERMVPELIGVNIDEVLANANSKDNIELRKDDELIVSSILNLKEQLGVDIRGEVQFPGTFDYVQNMTLYDLIILAGGFNEFASRKVEIARLFVSDEKDTLGIESEVITLEINSDYQSSAQNILLSPFDFVSIRKIQNVTSSQQVQVYGEVSYPGVYVVARENEQIYDIIERSGGLNAKANIKGVKIIRNSKLNRSDTLEQTQVVIPIDFKRVQSNPESRANIVVRGGDLIYVERLVNTTSVRGAVELSTEVPVKKGKCSRYYINAAGGFKENADKKRTYIIYANGMAKTTKRFLGIRFYPKVENGSVLVVPEKTDGEKRMSTQDVIALSSVMSTITGVTIAIITLLK